tara:strand:- start:1013 stop:2122 length:1110 start_codon:yes stop_codon:yes gene_type:complete
MKNRILFVVNDINFFESHRIEIANEAYLRGHDIYILSNKKIDSKNKYKFNYKKYYIIRKNKNILFEFFTFISLLITIFKIKPNIIHLITIKPIIYGGIISRIFKIKKIIFSFTGLGYLFINDRNRNKTLNFFLFKLILRIALNSKNSISLFQNSDDKNTISKLTKLNTSYLIIPGSGVDLSKFIYKKETHEKNTIVMVSRLLRDKGVMEYISAANLLKNKFLNLRFYLVGDIDLNNPTSLNNDEILQYKETSNVIFLGYRNDINKIYENSNIVVLPSYREGFPKSLIEGAACGRAIVTTNVPGCRDAIIDGETGILVEPKNSDELASAIEHLLKNKKKRLEMGIKSRKLAEKNYDINNVVEQHMKIYNI